ncbi:B12-binding domain-containing radical SAM protein [Anaerocolumna jejuensis]|uniref:B12-binding domain-containing radical SAM protein n=1 Tax=Anaerocolumna jejuensis TaxID=259063 RepID=UPI003F7C565B
MRTQIINLYYEKVKDKKDFDNDYENLDNNDIGRVYAFIRRNRIPVQLEYINCLTCEEEFHKVDTEADIILLYGDNTCREASYYISENLKQRKPNALIGLTGRFATEAGDPILNDCRDMDFILMEYPEYPFLDLIRGIEEGKTIEELGKEHPHIKTQKYREGKTFCNTDINLFPWADRSYLRYENGMTAYLCGSQGCLGNCSFCRISNHNLKWSGRSPQDIANEIIHIYETKGVKFFALKDCSMEDPGDIGKERLKQLCLALLEYPVRFGFRGYIRAESFHDTPEDKEIIKLLYEAGFRVILIGIEAGNDEDLIYYNKRARTKDNEEAIRLFREAGIDPIYGFIMINPHTTADKMKKNFEFLVKYKDFHLDDYINALRIFYNTPIFHQLKSEGLLEGSMDYKEYYDYKFEDSYVKTVFDFTREYFHDKKELTVRDLEFWDTIHLFYRMKSTVGDLGKVDEAMEELKVKLADRMAEYFEPLYMRRNMQECRNNYDKFKEDMVKLYEEAENLKLRLIRINLKSSKVI